CSRLLAKPLRGASEDRAAWSSHALSASALRSVRILRNSCRREYASRADGDASRTIPRKQRHTARRIYQRLRDEHGYEGAESTIRRVVAQLRRELDTDGPEPFFVLSPAPGEMAQVDWGQAKIVLAGVPTVVHLFCGRLHYSGVPFVWASLHEKLEAFLEGHVRWFAWVNGVVEKMVYDNLTPVVRKIVQGHEGRELSERFVALRSHYVFDSVFANPG